MMIVMTDISTKGEGQEFSNSIIQLSETCFSFVIFPLPDFPDETRENLRYCIEQMLQKNQIR